MRRIDLWRQYWLVRVAVYLLSVDAWYDGPSFARWLDARHLLERRVIEYALSCGIELMVELTIHKITVALVVYRCRLEVLV